MPPSFSPPLSSQEDDYIIVSNPNSPIMTSKDKDLDAISKTIEDLSSDLRRISLSIHDNPELQFKEYHAHKVLTSYLREQSGWDVTPSAYGIETAFVAVYDTGREGPVVSFNAEYGMKIIHLCFILLGLWSKSGKPQLISFRRCARRYRTCVRTQSDCHCIARSCSGLREGSC